MNRRGFLKLAVTAIGAACVPMGLPVAAPAKVLVRFGPLSAKELLGQWVCQRLDEDLVNAICGL